MAGPHRTTSGEITQSPLVLVDIETDSGVVGHAMVFTYTPAALKPTVELIQNIAPLIIDEVLVPTEKQFSL